MSRLVDEARIVLEAAGFVTFANVPSPRSTTFEDLSVLGQLHVLDSADEILKDWENTQDSFLAENADRLLRDSTKAWNLYTVFLTAEVPPPDVERQLFKIEDDFRGTRKLVRAGVASRQDLLAAMAPILPFENLLTVGPVDARARLAERLASLSPALRNLGSEMSAEAIVAALLGDL